MGDPTTKRAIYGETALNVLCGPRNKAVYRLAAGKPGGDPSGRRGILEGLPAQRAEFVHLSSAACREVDLVHGHAVRFLPEAEAVPAESADQLRGHRPPGFLSSVDGELDDDDRVGPQEDTGIPDGQPGAEEGRDGSLAQDFLLP